MQPDVIFLSHSYLNYCFCEVEDHSSLLTHIGKEYNFEKISKICIPTLNIKKVILQPNILAAVYTQVCQKQ